jgi:hypothetical protein
MDITKIWIAYEFESRIRDKVPCAVPFWEKFFVWGVTNSLQRSTVTHIKTG